MAMLTWRSEGARSTLLRVVTVIAAAASIPVVAAEPSAPANPFEELAAAEEVRLRGAKSGAEATGPFMALLELAPVMMPGRFDADALALVAREGHTDAVAGAKPAGAVVGVDNRLLAARARDWLARRAEEGGDQVAATGLREPLSLLSHFWVVGPFGDGRASFDVVYPPESEVGAPAVDRNYPGKERSVAWRRAEGAMRRGALDLASLLRPDSQAAAYASVYVRVEQATDAALRLGSPGPIKVWCNGVLVHAVDRARSARFDQDAVGIRLRAGWNRLLLKTVVIEGAWRLYARLTTPDGKQLAYSTDWEAPGISHSASKGRGRPPRVPVANLESVLRERVRAASNDAAAAAQAGVDLGRYLTIVDSTDRDQKEAGRAFDAAAARRPTVEALMGLAAAGRETDESRRALERALAVAKESRDRARVLSALGDVARDQHRDAVAVERWRAALEADPRWWPAVLSLAGEEQSTGFTATALARIERLPATVRALPPVARERARLLMSLDRRLEAESAWRGLLADARDNVDLLRELATTARARGDAAESIRLLGEAAALRPDFAGFVVDWARALEGKGDRGGARQVLEAAARRMPDEPGLAAELGKLLDRGGETADAANWLRTALQLRPQDPELRRYADSVGSRLSLAASSGASAGTRGELSRRFAAAVPTLLTEEAARARTKAGATASSSSVSAEPDSAVVLLDRRAVRVHPNGLSEVFAQRVVQVRTDSGARDNKEFFVRYTPGSEEVEILEARIFRRGAAGALEVLQASERDDQDLSEPWYGLYYDYRAEVVRFEGLRAGDVLEVQYQVSDVSRENQLAGYFGDLQFIAEAIPKRRWDYTLLGARGREFHFAKPDLAGVTQTTSDDGPERVTRFSAQDVPRIEIEPAMPGIGESSPYLHVSTYGSWDAVGRWYWRLIEEQLVADETVRAAAAAAVRSAGAAAGGKRRRALGDLDKVRALHALVVGGTRYVGLEFGIHGFKPYKVSQVLARKFGDCKDKAALLVAMLSQFGIDAEMVLLRTRRGGRIAPAPASLAVFDHAIVYVPKLGLYLDGTAEFSGMKELPSQDQGAMILRVSPRASTFTETPVLPSVNNRAARVWNVRLKPDGNAEVEERLTIEGQAAPDWRSHYQTPGERMDRYAKVWTARHPGARLSAVDMAGIEDRNQVVAVHATAAVPRFAEATPAGGLLLMPGARDPDLVRTYARLSSRRSDLVLAYPWRHEETIVYHLPVGYRPQSLPQSRRIATRFGSFELRVSRGASGTLTCQARLDVSHDRISPTDYLDFRRFLADVDATLSERIVLGPAPEGTGVAGALH